METNEDPLLWCIYASESQEELMRNLKSRGPFYKHLSSSWFKSYKQFVLTWKMMAWLGHKFAHATAAELPWHVQVYDLNELLRIKVRTKLVLTWFQLWTFKPSLKWVSAVCSTWMCSGIFDWYYIYICMILISCLSDKHHISLISNVNSKLKKKGKSASGVIKISWKFHMIFQFPVMWKIIYLPITWFCNRRVSGK